MHKTCNVNSSMVMLESIWRSKEINFKTIFKLYKSLGLSTLLYGCETQTLYEDSKKISAFRCLLQIRFREHKINLYVQAVIVKKTGYNTKYLDTVYQRKLSFYGQQPLVILGNQHENLCKTIVQGYMEGKRKRGRPQRGWTDDLIDYIQLSLDNLLEK